MKNLIQGIVEFRKNLTPEYRTLFAKLALGQKPNAFVVACSDSRVVPNLFASTNPGDLFMLRNIGNLMPPYAIDSREESCAQASLEFSVQVLNISDIVICGHSECSAMQTIAQGLDRSGCPHLVEWLKYGEESFKKVLSGIMINPGLSTHNQLSQVNVLQQMEHIATYPFVRERLDKKQLRIHGWWFDIAQADVYCYEQSQRQFVLIDSDEAELIIQRMEQRKE